MPSDPAVTVATLRAWLETGTPVTVLDIRPASQRAEWSIPGSLHVDAYDRLRADDPQALASVDLPTAHPVVVVCAAGQTSLRGAAQLRARGVLAVSLAGGMNAWSLAWNTAEVPLSGSTAQVIQIRRSGKGCLSYLIGTGDAALVIDAALDPAVYAALAAQHGWLIRLVLDTHVHADHLSRSRQLAAATGATLYLPAQERVRYPFTALRDGDTLAMGAARLTVLSTPGHTAESCCLWLDDRVLFTGDTLFPTAVGRPDLEATTEEAAAHAAALYQSLARIFALPAATLVLAGHTTPPVAFDHEPLGATLGTIRAQVRGVEQPVAAFVADLLGRLPPPPPNHQRIVACNEAGQFTEPDDTALEAGGNRCAVG